MAGVIALAALIHCKATQADENKVTFLLSIDFLNK
jgi:hypothetical protein